MYVIMVYDVQVQRVAKVLKIGRRYLTWVQNSVLEGYLTQAQFRRLKEEVRRTINSQEDSVLFYTLRTTKGMHREVIGISKNEPDFFA